ncbi:ATP-binding protein [Actinacidiphila sp. bgisy144]|uniref:ATP-binding protein n=1 Tax=Actinacidiphila sp. bgisy144 TaxID=3413791 RepID=UPI003EB758FC
MTVTSTSLLAEIHGCPSRDVLSTVVDDLTLIVDHESPSQEHGMPASTAMWAGALRRIGAKKLAACGLAALVDDAQLLISELVTNALQHGAGHQLVFHLAIGTDEIVMAVSDGSPEHPTVRRAGAEEENGRGMFLVDALADAWGVSPDGTSTWCLLTVPEAARNSVQPGCRKRRSPHSP